MSGNENHIFEQSAGGIVYKKTPAGVLVLLLFRTGMKGGTEYVLPKGHIEGEETVKQAALREINEETGLATKELKVIKFITKINYSFIATYKAGNPTIDKDVYLFLVRYTGKNEVKIDKWVASDHEKFTGFRWFSVEELKNMDLKPNIYHFIEQNMAYL